VDRVIGLSDNAWQDPTTADKLSYVEAVANEAMRCKPVGGHLFLEPNEDVQIEDIFVPRGTPILALSGYVGTQEKNFAQADEFRPERWLESAMQRQHTGAQHEGIHAIRGRTAILSGTPIGNASDEDGTAMLCRDFSVSRPPTLLRSCLLVHGWTRQRLLVVTAAATGTARDRHRNARSRATRRSDLSLSLTGVMLTAGNGALIRLLVILQ
jgi:hypothetical protein